MDNTEDRIIYRHDLREILQVTSETLRRWAESGKLPPPDVNFSLKCRGWKLSTLRKAGINIF